MKNYILWGCLFLFSFPGQGAPLEEDHFLAPRDQEVLWLTGIERGLGRAGTYDNIQRCQREERITHLYRQFHCRLFKETKKVSLSLPYDESTFAQLNFFGETHTNQNGQQYLAKLIEESPSGYFKVLAMEMFNASAQKSINDLSQRKAPLHEWRELLTQHWRYNLDGYLSLISSALSKGMRIIALDDRREDHSDSFSEDLIYRDKVMARNLSKAIESFPEDRFLILTGKLHSFRKISQEPITIREELRRDGLLSKHFLLFKEKAGFFFQSFYPNHKGPLALKALGIDKKYADFFIVL